MNKQKIFYLRQLYAPVNAIDALLLTSLAPVTLAWKLAMYKLSCCGSVLLGLIIWAWFLCRVSLLKDCVRFGVVTAASPELQVWTFPSPAVEGFIEAEPKMISYPIVCSRNGRRYFMKSGDRIRIQMNKTRWQMEWKMNFLFYFASIRSVIVPVFQFSGVPGTLFSKYEINRNC